jgi:hypothetical protein
MNSLMKPMVAHAVKMVSGGDKTKKKAEVKSKIKMKVSAKCG